MHKLLSGTFFDCSRLMYPGTDRGAFERAEPLNRERMGFGTFGEKSRRFPYWGALKIWYISHFDIILYN